MMQLDLFGPVVVPTITPVHAEEDATETWWTSPSGFHHYIGATGDSAVMLVPNIAADGLSDAPGFTVVVFAGPPLRQRVVRKVGTDLGGEAARTYALGELAAMAAK